MAAKQTDLQVLSHIQNTMMTQGNDAAKGYKTHKNINAGKLAISSYRCAIQALRYKVVHKTPIVKSKRKKK